MPESSKKIGGVEITALSDGVMEVDLPSVYPDVPSSAWDLFKGVDVMAQDKHQMNFGCYLLRTPSLVVLVDTGMGGGLLEEMASYDVRPEHVQIATYAHLHGDHIGGNLSGSGSEARSTFPNARYVVPRGDWAYFVERTSPGYNPSVEEMFQLFSTRGQVELVDDGHRLSPELTILATPGHTPGHCCIAVESQGQRAIIIGDAIIHPIQVAHPEWNSAYDQDPSTATRTRQQLLDRMEREDALGGVSHMLAPGFGRVAREGGTRAWLRE